MTLLGPRMKFSANSVFADVETIATPEEHAAAAQAVVNARPKEDLKALFASTTAGWQGQVVEIKSGQLRSWWHDIDDAMTNLEEGSTRGLERAVIDLEALRDRIDDVIRSANATPVRSDRPAG